jgi:hypothetical protein
MISVAVAEVRKAVEMDETAATVTPAVEMEASEAERMADVAAVT